MHISKFDRFQDKLKSLSLEKAMCKTTVAFKLCLCPPSALKRRLFELEPDIILLFTWNGHEPCELNHPCLYHAVGSVQHTLRVLGKGSFLLFFMSAILAAWCDQRSPKTLNIAHIGSSSLRHIRLGGGCQRILFLFPFQACLQRVCYNPGR